ncbi:MAG: ATP-binding protein [bacterium]
MHELHVSSVGIDKLLHDVVEEMNIPSTIRVDWDIDGSLPNILADKERLCEIAHNLIKNAIESMGEKGVLSIQGAVDGEFVRIIISDTGKGMSEEEISRMFTPFYTNKATGKGLGMAVVKRLIEAHKGTIDVESKIGAGTRVVIRLVR